MMTWAKYPVMEGLTVLLFTLAILLAGIDPSSARPGRSASSIRVAQTSIITAPLQRRSGKGIVIRGTVKKPGGYTRPPAGSIPKPPIYQPRPKPPIYRPKPKPPTVTWPRPRPPIYRPKPKPPTVTWPRPRPPIYQPRPRPPTVTWPRPKPPAIWLTPAPPRTVTPGHEHNDKTNTARRGPTPPARIQPIPQFIANEVVVLIARDQPVGVDDAVAQSLGLVKLSAAPVALLEGRLVRYRIPGNRPMPQVIAALTADRRVTLAQPNNIYLTLSKMKRAGKAPVQYALAKLGLEPVHKISQGRDVSVAVIDTGIDISHPVLAKAVYRSFDAVGDGKARPQRHGTAVAGLIAGRGKVKGVAPLSSLLSVRAFYMHPVYKRPVTSSAILLRALDWSFANKARIFNLSFAGPFDPLVKAALTSASDKGVILVAAAGNGGPKAAPAYPAAYENVIAITALDHKDKLYAQANHGSYLTAAAPGVDVLVPSLKKGYRYSSGTSLAAAHISGLVALLLERHPDATAGAIVDAIQKSAHDLGPKGHDTQFGAGRADAYATLIALSNGQ